MPAIPFHSLPGGTHVAIWDLMKGGVALQDAAQLPSSEAKPHQRPLFRLSNHQKAVTSLHISPSVTVADPDGTSSQTLPPRLLTGSLDGHVRFFSIHDYKVCACVCVCACVHACPCTYVHA